MVLDIHEYEPPSHVVFWIILDNLGCVLARLVLVPLFYLIVSPGSNADKWSTGEHSCSSARQWGHRKTIKNVVSDMGRGDRHIASPRPRLSSLCWKMCGKSSLGSRGTDNFAMFGFGTDHLNTKGHYQKGEKSTHRMEENI